MGPPEFPRLMTASVWMKSSMAKAGSMAQVRILLKLRVEEAERTALGAHDSRRHGVVQLVGPDRRRIPDSRWPEPIHPTLRFSEWPKTQEGETIQIDLDHRHVGGGIGAHDRGDEIPAVQEIDPDFVGIGYDVVVGENVTVLGNHETGAAAHHWHVGMLSAVFVVREVEEPAELLGDLHGAGHGPGGGDLDSNHGRCHRPATLANASLNARAGWTACSETWGCVRMAGME